MSLTVQSRSSTTPLPATLALGPVEITVRDSSRALEWYQRALGLHVRVQGDGTAELGDRERTIVRVVEDPQAQPAGRHPGLYHYALLYPSRQDLARALVRIVRTETPIQGASDHGTHEAIYLPDPDGNGIELAADRPRDRWPTPEEEFGAGGPRPLDMEALLATIAGETPEDQIRDGLRMGHVHLHVGSVDDGLAFYSDVLGFDVWAQIPTAAFVSAGGYHHHLGFNTWRGAGAPAAPDHTVGLRHWTVELESSTEVAEVRGRVEAAGHPVEDVDGGFAVRDPWGIELRILSA